MDEAASYTVKVAIFGLVIAISIIVGGLWWWDANVGISDLDQAYMDALDGCAEDFTGSQFDKCFSYTKNVYNCVKSGSTTKECMSKLGNMMD